VQVKLISTSTYAPAEDLADAAVRDAQLSGNVARADTLTGQLDDLMSDGLRQRSPVDEDSAQLVQATAASVGFSQHTDPVIRFTREKTTIAPINI